MCWGFVGCAQPLLHQSVVVSRHPGSKSTGSGKDTDMPVLGLDCRHAYPSTGEDARFARGM